MSSLQLHDVLRRLALIRPIFHSEADFQHALAWQIHLEYPNARIRLETRPERGARLDLLVQSDNETAAIEVKYLVARFEGTVDGVTFNLPNQGAHDIARHDFIKDLARVERFVQAGVADTGWAVALTNDQNYWQPGWKAEPIDAAFRIHEGRRAGGDDGMGQSRRRGHNGKERYAALPPWFLFLQLVLLLQHP